MAQNDQSFYLVLPCSYSVAVNRAQVATFVEQETDTVSFIGAGAAGSSTAWHLQQFAARSEIPINITVFEKAAYVGGRSTTVNAYDDPHFPVELGASIFVEVNEILKNSSELFNLKPRTSETEDAEILGIWNGEKFVYTQKDSGWYWFDIAKLIWKYGLAPIRTQRLMKSVVGKFRQLYLSPYFPFRSLSEAVTDLDLVSVTAITGEQLLTANNVSCRDLIESRSLLILRRSDLLLQRTLSKPVLV